jgi:hypothetical protein
MNRRAKLTLTTLTTTALLCLAVALPAGDVLAQQPEYPPQHREYQYQRVSFKASAANSKYTQHYNIDVGDAPGHQVRVFEIRRTFPNNAPAINGVKLVELWNRGASDLFDGDGAYTTYSVFVMENGDKFFAQTARVAESIGSGKFTTSSTGTITGGTGKFFGIEGIVQTVGTDDPKAGFAEAQYDIEYRREK